MPVSFSVAMHPAKPFPFPNGRDGYTPVQTFTAACIDQSTKAGELLQISLAVGQDPIDATRTQKIPDIVPNKNSFVATLLDAYTQDRAVVIRPDDVWLAILCQFNFFVNANAELLRANFVAHDGKKELIVNTAGNRYSMDMDLIAGEMAGLIEKNVVDPTLRAWAMPDFTTTTLNDKTVSAVILMATLKKYFAYTIMVWGCGIPRVTLEGEKADWVNILGRLEKLKEYGLETIAWYHLLHPVIRRFVAAFDAPTSPDNVDFWQRIAHYTPGGSAEPGDYYTGWISAFTVFDKDGRWMGNPLNKEAAPVTAPETLTASQFWATYGGPNISRDLVLDGSLYHRLDSEAIPPGYGEVDVVVIEDGIRRFECAMVAGSVATRVSSSGDAALSENGADDTVRPIAGWWLFVKDETDMEKRAELAYGEIGGEPDY
ncbi:hypothetical protein K438DRAFT_1933439 [Mycena galopus ATCC 62051]|nr:hypothetical protein K438DRAFT_1933439 [Mycena galopus ATCC 62051]